MNASHINWQVDEGDIEFLPTMQTDIVLQCEENTHSKQAGPHDKISGDGANNAYNHVII
ncbi:hypothetical protein [Sporosarcina jiandibaonis]|uniref:hypothetical protein n=1 Tax=Sporosarcina jiandibaonis TaxID=2715535 RepID=UPI001556E801|nr:hypothetical protein [Sporosarcina jiandibaonis]